MNNPSNSLSAPKKAVLLLSYGTPQELDDIPAYLTNIRGGRPPSPTLVQQISERYQQINGSPLLEISSSIAQKLSQAINLPVYLGMRHWHPLIQHVIPDMLAEGFEEITAIPLTPHYSEVSIGAYQDRVNAALNAADRNINLRFIRYWPDQPDYLAGLKAHTQMAVDLFSKEEQDQLYYVFTAHSLPQAALPEDDPYTHQLTITAKLLATHLNLDRSRWQLAYQSAPSNGEGWLGPQLKDVIQEADGYNRHHYLVVPIGFLMDHLEILYDIDIAARQWAENQGIRLERAPMLNDSDFLIAALTNLIQDQKNREMSSS